MCLCLPFLPKQNSWNNRWSFINSRGNRKFNKLLNLTNSENGPSLCCKLRTMFRTCQSKAWLLDGWASSLGPSGPDLIINIIIFRAWVKNFVPTSWAWNSLQAQKWSRSNSPRTKPFDRCNVDFRAKIWISHPWSIR